MMMPYVLGEAAGGRGQLTGARQRQPSVAAAAGVRAARTRIRA
jgi:hypothetical protein